jgi:hypothetical protein
MNVKAQRIATVGLLGALLAGCGGGDANVQPTPTAANTRPASTGKLTVLEPSFGEVVKGPSVTVKVKLENARVLKPGKGTLRLEPDTGHIHVALDGETLTLTAGLMYTIDEVESGEHLLRVEFAANDHGAFNPPVLTDVRFTVE